MASFAWNWQGHVAITELAYHTLDVDTKAKLDKIINSLDKSDQDLLANLRKRFQGPINKLALLSILPDKWSIFNTRHFFENLDVALPKALYQYADTQVAKLHYADQPYPEYDCKIPSPNVEDFIPQIEQALMAAKDDKTKMVLLILLSHFVGDIHQPLHVISHVDKECKSDLGGIKFCVQRGKGGRCAYNLHYLWDSSMFFFSRRMQVKKIDKILSEEYPSDHFTKKQIENSDIKTWAQEVYEYTPFIYSIKQDKGLPDDYKNKAMMIAKERSALAAYRLANLITRMLSK